MRLTIFGAGLYVRLCTYWDSKAVGRKEGIIVRDERKNRDASDAW